MSAKERSPLGRQGTPRGHPETTAGRRRRTFRLPCSDEDYAVLVQAAGDAGLPLSRYVVDAALTFTTSPGSALRAEWRQDLIGLMAARTQVSQVRSAVMRAVDTLGEAGHAAQWNEALARARRAIQHIDEATDVLVDRLR